MSLKSVFLLAFSINAFTCLSAQEQKASTPFSYRVETSVSVADGRYAPLWFTANRYGLSSQEPKSAYLRAGVQWQKEWQHGWRVQAGADLAGGKNLTADFFVQQAYMDVAWKAIKMSIGSKERNGFPLEKDVRLSSGMMVEGANARPIPQVRVGLPEYLTVPFTGNWLALKGHIAYGLCTDGNWQEEFAGADEPFLKDVLYHSKSLMLRFGNREKLPLELEIGLLDIAQFGGKRYVKNADGSIKLLKKYPAGLKSFFKALVPAQESTLQNVEGNHSGSWNAALSYYAGDWKIRAYMEHFFEDHSQMFMEYGMWKDGQLGLEVTLPRNRWVNRVLWEGLSTKDQTGPILYDGIAGSFPEFQISGGDEYFNNGQYLAWQHWGMGMGNGLIPGSVYNDDGTMLFKSTRVKAHHIGFCGEPDSEWNYRVLASYVRHWGTYPMPLDKVRKQFSSMVEVSYCPRKWTGWSATLAFAMDRGNYLGNSMGAMLTVRKTGGFGK